jgi:lipoprotein-anchoring transpeptidase ErfK/SrfK
VHRDRSSGSRNFAAAALLIAAALGMAVRPCRASADSHLQARRPAAPLHLVADLSRRRLLVVGRDTFARYAIAIGLPDHPTPTGRFRIAKLVWNPPWVPPAAQRAAGKEDQAAGAPANPMRLVKIFFQEPDYYIHGTNDPASIGDAESHGCLRMEPMDAYRLGRTLMRHGGASRSPAWFRRVLRVRTATETVRLRRPISMDIID